MRSRMRLGVIGAVTALVLSACGDAGDDGDDGGDGAPEYPVAESPDFDAGTAMADLAEAGSIKIGVKFDQPGIGNKRAGVDEPEGFDIEIGKIIAAELGIAPEDIEWIETISDNREPFLQQGTVDLVIASYSITDERREVVGQAGPYYITGQQILVRDGSDITGPDDVDGVEVCSVTGSTSLAQIEAKGAKGVGRETYSQCRDQVLDGAVEAMTTDGAILLGYAAENPDELEVVGEAFSTERYGVGYAKDQVELCQFIVDTISGAQDDGLWAEAYEFTLGKGGGETPEPPEMDACPES